MRRNNIRNRIDTEFNQVNNVSNFLDTLLYAVLYVDVILSKTYKYSKIKAYKFKM